MATTLASQPGADPPGRGVPETLARERAGTIRSLRYELAFVVPAYASEPVQGRAILRFTLAAPYRVVLDFAQPRDRVRSLRAGGSELPVTFGDGHLTIPAQATRAGENESALELVASDEPLNRDQEVLYTLFVPARAHRAFPCFDQPDLKARHSLSLDVPAGWEAVANGAASTIESDAQRTRVRFAETQPIPTYLFAFVAGKLSVETARRNGREFRMFHRETDAAKVARNREAIFELHAAALAWLEDYTAIPYPFGKFDFVAIPSFQFGGMEYPGAILDNAASLLLEESATQNQPRALPLISHRVADPGSTRGWLPVSLGALRAPRTAIRLVHARTWGLTAGPSARNENKILVTSRIAVQMLDRASAIAHERSHMWFGDLVTMRWFNDCRTRRSFACSLNPFALTTNFVRDSRDAVLFLFAMPSERY